MYSDTMRIAVIKRPILTVSTSSMKAVRAPCIMPVITPIRYTAMMSSTKAAPMIIEDTSLFTLSLNSTPLVTSIAVFPRVAPMKTAAPMPFPKNLTVAKPKRNENATPRAATTTVFLVFWAIAEKLLVSPMYSIIMMRPKSARTLSSSLG